MINRSLQNSNSFVENYNLPPPYSIRCTYHANTGDVNRNEKSPTVTEIHSLSLLSLSFLTRNRVNDFSFFERVSFSKLKIVTKFIKFILISLTKIKLIRFRQRKVLNPVHVNTRKP